MTEEHQEQEQEEEQEQEQEEQQQIEIDLRVLDALYNDFTANVLGIDNLEPDPRREALRSEAWNLTQVQVATTIRQSKADVYTHLITFFRKFPEAIPALANEEDISKSAPDQEIATEMTKSDNAEGEEE